MTKEKQSKIIAALLTEPTRGRAAKRAGVSVRMLYDYMREPGFAAEYSKAADRILNTAAGQLQGATVEAVECLRGVILDESAKASDRVKAAQVTLEYCMKITELRQIVQRIEALEKQLNEG